MFCAPSDGTRFDVPAFFDSAGAESSCRAVISFNCCCLSFRRRSSASFCFDS